MVASSLAVGVMLVVMVGAVKISTPVNVCPASVLAMVAEALGKVIVVLSVPENARVLFTVKVLEVAPPAMVNPVVRAVGVKALNVVAVKLPVFGLKVNLVEDTFCAKLPVFAVTQVGYIVAAVVVSSVIAVVAALPALPETFPVTSPVKAPAKFGAVTNPALLTLIKLVVPAAPPKICMAKEAALEAVSVMVYFKPVGVPVVFQVWARLRMDPAREPEPARAVSAISSFAPGAVVPMPSRWLVASQKKLALSWARVLAGFTNKIEPAVPLVISPPISALPTFFQVVPL